MWWIISPNQQNACIIQLIIWIKWIPLFVLHTDEKVSLSPGQAMFFFFLITAAVAVCVTLFVCHISGTDPGTTFKYIMTRLRFYYYYYVKRAPAGNSYFWYAKRRDIPWHFGHVWRLNGDDEGARWSEYRPISNLPLLVVWLPYSLSLSLSLSLFLHLLLTYAFRLPSCINSLAYFFPHVA